MSEIAPTVEPAVQGQESAIESEYYLFAVGANTARFALRGDWTILNLEELEDIIEHLDIHRIPVREL